jgi:hypothetical protein
MSSITLQTATDVEDLEAVEELKDEGDHAVVGGDGQVHHNLYDQYQIDARAEHAVHLLLLTGFFHSKGIIKNLRIREYRSQEVIYFSQIVLIARILPRKGAKGAMIPRDAEP